MHKYYLNSTEITKAQFKQLFEKHKDCKVVLRIDTLNATYNREDPQDVISPEKAKELRNLYKRH